MRTIRIGGVPEHYNLPFYQLAQEQALLSLGIQFDWQTYPSGTGHILSDLQKGVLDMAIVLTEGAVLGRSAGDKVEIYSTYVTSPLSWGVHAKAKSGSTSIDQFPLNKSIFGISRYGSGSHLMAALYAHRKGHHLTKAQFQVVNNLPGAILALDVGMADLFLWEKFTTQPVVDQGIFVRVDEFLTPWDPFVLVGNSDATEVKLEVVPPLLDWLRLRCVKLKTEKVLTVEEICQTFSLSKNAALRWLDRVEWNINPVTDQSSYNWIEALLLEAGVIVSEKVNSP